jgi:DNA-directed RNA polymerase
MKQADLNAEMRELGVRRYRSNLAKNRGRGLETVTKAGRRVLEHSTSSLCSGIRSWKDQAKARPGRRHRVYPHLKGIKDSVLALIASRAILDGISTVRSITGLANHVGRLVEDEVKVAYLKKHHKDLWRVMSNAVRKHPSEQAKMRHIKSKAKYNEVKLPSWSVPDRIAVGLVLVELFRQHTDIIDISTRTNAAGRGMTIVKATPEFLEWLNKSHEAIEDLHPVYMPMISKPCDWKGMWGGGYSLDSLGGFRPLVKATDRQYLATLDNADLTNLYSAINHIQSTEWIINDTILDVIRHCWQENLAVGDIPDKTGRPIPPKPADISTNKESRRQWRKAAAYIHYENDAAKSKLYTVARAIGLAERFSGKSLWFPQELDFRGRVYPKPIFLNNQGADWQRALLKFAKGKPVDAEAKRWLAIHGANCSGNDKIPFDDRVRWVEQNEQMILACGNDPLGCMEWAKTDKPFSFLAFCVEWAALAKNPKHLCSLPCHLDGSNNGLQLISLLMRDVMGASATNCLPSLCPNDIYQIVASRSVQKLIAIRSPEALAWVDFGITRKTTKRVVMCLPYGLTKYSAKAYIREWFVEECRSRPSPFSGDGFREIQLLSKVIWESITETVSAATQFMDWLRQVAAVHIECGIPIRWTAPNGFLVQQAYKKLSRVTVKTSIGSALRQHVAVVDQDSLSKTRNQNGISPNVIHSLDAALLTRAVNMLRWQGVDSVSCIHDSIGVCPADVSTLSRAVRACAIEMFSEPVLDQMYAEMKSYLPPGKPLPAPPALGTMDLSQLQYADYFFS